MTGHEIRPLRADDAAEAAALINGVHRHFRGHDLFTTEEFQAVLEFPSTVPERDGRWLVDAQGVARGLVAVVTTEPWSTAQMHLSVLPGDDRREVTERLLATGIDLARGRRELRPDAVLEAEGVPREDDVVRTALAGGGFTRVRETAEMRRRLTDLPVVAWPRGVSAEVLRADDLDQLTAAAEVSREAFTDHDGDYVIPVDDFVHMVRSMPTARADLSLLASDPSGPVGLALSFSSLDSPPTGYVGTLAVVRRARGRGVARALLAESFHRFADQGWEVAKLHVQIGNRTGADRLYGSVGMEAGAVDETWAGSLASL
jgi:mycothiol synthase